MDITKVSESDEDLRCPICFELPPEEVFQCKNGHAICKTCSSRLQNCPQCRISFNNGKIRNRVLEALLDNLEFACAYQNEGCSDIMARKELPTHLQICKFRPVQLCKILGHKRCTFASYQSTLVFNHFVTRHAKQILQGPKITVILLNFGTKSEWRKSGIYTKPLEVTFGSDIERFLICVDIQLDKGGCSLMCLHMGNCANEASRFRVNFAIPHLNQQKSKWEWTGEPICFKGVEATLTNPACWIPLEYLDRHFGENPWVTVVSVRRQQA